ncbi:5-methylthioadenosine/S-adenosylhomocysteine deaminase [Jatrophihabitans sp. GAS493]|uniref:amidohydrolase family protein n=1 Tax=Jatrophihabitans sp. GAS493 TaxID=1907575 RepID=UPI000BB6FE37|nr:amidohydrolase family protein [Jatrophihabitans sp. GAS493]SOD74820.1 5-methylthioadenosine/S-adenosylhomocysteine deaminase [Jatrophihabitans sp. GAS493]
MTGVTGGSSSILFRDVLVYDASVAGSITAATDVLVDDERVAAIGAEARRWISESTRIIEGHGHHLLIPGLINAHFHSPANHLKGSFDSLPLELFMLMESPAGAEFRATPREAYLRTMLAILQMLRTGTTAVQDDAFLMPYPEPEIIDAVMQAYADAGIRASVALDQPELPEAEKLPVMSGDREFQRALTAPAPMNSRELLKMYDHLISNWHGAESGRLTAAVSVSAPQRVSVGYFEAIDDLSRRHNLPLFAHMLETKLQRTLARELPRMGGHSLVRYTADHGLLSNRMNVIHAVWVDDADLDLIAAAGATVAHNPISNLRLGSGVMPFRRVAERGIPICLGVDEAICDDSVNMWPVLKMAGLIHNISGLESDQWPTAGEVLNCLFDGGARALLQSHQLGAIHPGYLADLALLDLHTLPFTPLNDIEKQLVYCHSGESVVLTMVAGRIVFEEGQIVTVDEPALLDEARALFAKTRRARAGAYQDVQRVLPNYQAMVNRARTTDVGMNRWVTG